VSRPPPASRPSLWPREHGATAQFLLPLATALAISRPRLAAAAFAVCALAGFLAHEPVLILLGRRGGRQRRELAIPARRRLKELALLAIVTGIFGALRAPPAALLAGAATALFVAVASLILHAGREKTLVGELFAAITLCASSVPIALAGGAPLTSAVAVASSWATVFVLGTLTVHTLLQRIGGAAVVAVAVTAGVAGIASATYGHVLWPIGLVPPAIATAVLLLVRPGAKHLRRIGWSMVAADLGALLLFIVGLRA
jgi:uncharacterized membrane protein (UPF0136 family)